MLAADVAVRYGETAEGYGFEYLPSLQFFTSLVPIRFLLLPLLQFRIDCDGGGVVFHPVSLSIDLPFFALAG